MSILHALVLGIVQGSTEFLPVSSSAHLILVPWWLKWDEPPFIYDAIVHVATALATLIYFWRDWLHLARAAWAILRKRAVSEPDEWLVVLLVVATIPAATIGFLLQSYFEGTFSDIPMTALQLLITAALLVVAEWLTTPERARKMESLSLLDALIIGIAQTIAILPGISRSGATIAAGLWRNLTREQATRFSFLMATPIILGGGAKKFLDVATGDVAVNGNLTGALIVGFVTSLVVGYASIAFLLDFVRHRKLYPFAIYCTAFALITLVAVAIRG